MIDAAEIKRRGHALRAIAEDLAGKPVVFGPEGDDCSSLPLQWVVGCRQFETGVEPHVELPEYSSQEEAEAVIARSGGLVNVWMPICSQLGLSPIAPQDMPVIGDVGIFETSRGQVGGIFLHGGIIMWRADTGTRAIFVWGRSSPIRRADGWAHIPVVAQAWRV